MSWLGSVKYKKYYTAKFCTCTCCFWCISWVFCILIPLFLSLPGNSY